MGSYTIGQVAERSGFAATALRYYEGIGLVPPAGRTDGGYRVYDDSTLARLGFIARAKQLGCTLEEITDLVEIWNGERCGPVQRRLHELVTDKLGAANAQIVELTAFAGQLRSAAAQLSLDPVDGPCDDHCACLQGPAGDAATMTFGVKPVEVPIACTLDATAAGDRLAEWDAMLKSAGHRVALPGGGVRIEFDATVDVAELARLARAEQQCCAFFQFAVTIDGRGVGLEVRAPAEALDFVTGLFGAPS